MSFASRNDAKVSDNAGKEQATNTKDKVNDGKKSQTKVENPLVDGFDDVKANKKKKSKSENNKDEDVLLSVSNEHQKKSKDKKHKDESHEKKEEMSDLSEVETLEKVDDVSKKDKKEKSKSKKKKEAIVVENTNDDVGKKLSKKRKKPASEEDETGGVEKEVFDDSKRRKKDNIDQSNGSKTPDGSVNGVLENDKKESWSKDKTKLSNGSSEVCLGNVEFVLVVAYLIFCYVNLFLDLCISCMSLSWYLPFMVSSCYFSLMY